MKKTIVILLVLCSTALIVTSCKSRCTREEEKALNMPKDSRLIGMWRLLDVTPTSAAGEYMILKANGIRKEGFSPYDINLTDIWYTVDGYLYDYDCISYNPMTGKLKYTVTNDTLTVMENNSKYGEIKTVYIRVKE